MSSKTITIDSQHLKLGNSKRKNTTVKHNITTTSGGTKINIHNSNIRELLLSKLQQHREKTQKRKYIQQISTPDTKINMDNPFEKNNIISSTTNENIITETQSPLIKNEIIMPDKPYGILKNGNKPTYKTWNNNQKHYINENMTNNMNENMNQNMNNNMNETNNIINPILQTNNFENIEPKPTEIPIERKESMESLNNIQNPIVPSKMIQQTEVKKNFKLGLNKKNKTISILIKNDTTRKNIEKDKTTFKKTPITTVKNYLKKKNFIKFGVTAPSQLMRDMYENLKLCGDVVNENPNLLIENLKQP